jgi:pyruvate dehydrogenase E1 component alpha subunit
MDAVEQGLRRVIGDGNEPDRRVEGLDDDALLELHRSLVLLRTYDERSVVYHRQGRIGTYAIYRGHEAIQAGLVHALERRDWIFPSYRDSAIGLLRGLPAATVLQWWRGHPSGWWNPEDVNVASICVPIATQVPHAAGLAWGLALKGSDAVAAVLFGDGATSEGAFHEGRTSQRSSRHRSSSFATTTSGRSRRRSARRTAAARLADKAVGYGMPGLRVDGHDVLSVYEAVREGVARARAGEGPTFVEAVTYRSAPHATADDPSLYIDPDRVAAEQERDCVALYEAYLTRLGLLDEARIDSVREEALATMRAAIQAAEDEAPPDPELVFSHAYANPPASLAQDLEELRRVHA